MTALAPSHGSRADFYVGTAGTPGTAIAITQYVDTASLGFSRDKAEVSAFKQLFKSYVMGLCDLTIPLQGPADVNVTTQIYGLFIMTGAGAAIAWEWAPLGVGTTGSPLWSGFGAFDKYEEKSATSGAYTWTANFQNSGTPVRTVQ
jgi:hypothetical protein